MVEMTAIIAPFVQSLSSTLQVLREGRKVY